MVIFNSYVKLPEDKNTPDHPGDLAIQPRQVILRLRAAAGAKGETALTLTRGSCVNQASDVGGIWQNHMVTPDEETHKTS
jgi:hypothetical protein